jgi:hypothetical protein
MIKRKSSANLISDNEKRIENLQHASHSLSNSISAKMILAGSKAFNKIKTKDNVDKISLN